MTYVEKPAASKGGFFHSGQHTGQQFAKFN